MVIHHTCIMLLYLSFIALVRILAMRTGVVVSLVTLGGQHSLSTQCIYDGCRPPSVTSINIYILHTSRTKYSTNVYNNNRPI